MFDYLNPLHASHSEEAESDRADQLLKQHTLNSFANVMKLSKILIISLGFCATWYELTTSGSICKRCLAPRKLLLVVVVILFTVYLVTEIRFDL